VSTVDDFVESLNRLLTKRQDDLAVRLRNGQFATYEEAKGYAARIRGLEDAREIAQELRRRRDLADFVDEEPLGGLDGSPALPRGLYD
jgi:hypothetical protein